MERAVHQVPYISTTRFRSSKPLFNLVSVTSSNIAKSVTEAAVTTKIMSRLKPT